MSNDRRTAQGEDILAYLGRVVREGSRPDERKRDLAVLGRHTGVESCDICEAPFPCYALRGMAARYGWTEGER